MSRFDAFILLLISCYFIVFSVISVNRYWQYEVHYLDFGIYDEAIWKVANFKSPIVDKGDNGKIIFADHFAPGMFLLSPLYWLTDRREIMFITQVLSVSLAAWVAYIIARSLLKNKIAVTALIISFLGFVGMQNALITELHEIVFAVLPLTLVFWAIERKRWKWYFGFLLLLLSFKESNAGLAIGVGLYLLLRYRKVYAKYAAGTVIIGLLWGIVTTMVIIPAFNESKYAYAPSFLQGQSLPQVASRFLDLKVKRETFAYTFATFGFLPFFDISIWPAVFEHYLERFVLTTDGTRFNMGFHYNSILVPILFMGALNVFQKLEKRVSGKIISLYSLAIIAGVIVISRFIYHGPIDLFYNRAFYEQSKNLTYIDDFVKIFPKSGLVLTQSNLAPRLTHGPDIRLIRSKFAALHPDYVILDLTPGQRFIGTDQLAVEIKDYYLNDPDYTLSKVHNDQYLFSKRK